MSLPKLQTLLHVCAHMHISLYKASSFRITWDLSMNICMRVQSFEISILRYTNMKLTFLKSHHMDIKLLKLRSSTCKTSLPLVDCTTIDVSPFKYGLMSFTGYLG